MRRVFVKTAKIELLEELKNGDVRVQNFGDNSDTWIIPRDTFKNTYQEDSSLYIGCFGRAIQAMEQGYKVARKGWNGKGIFIELQIPNELSKMTRPYIYIDTTGLQTDNKFAPKDRVPWLASQTDMLAKDWEIVE